MYQHRWLVVVLSLTGVATFNTASYIGLSTMESINAFLFQAAIPIFTAMLGWLFLRQSLRPRQVMGIVVSLAGVVCIVAQGQWTHLLQMQLQQGSAWLLLAMFAYAVYSLALQRLPKQVHPLALVLATFLLGTCVLLPLGWYENAVLQKQWQFNQANICRYCLCGYFSLGLFLHFLQPWRCIDWGDQSLNVYLPHTSVRHRHVDSVFARGTAIVPWHWHGLHCGGVDCGAEKGTHCIANFQALAHTTPASAATLAANNGAQLRGKCAHTSLGISPVRCVVFARGCRRSRRFLAGGCGGRQGAASNRATRRCGAVDQW